MAYLLHSPREGAAGKPFVFCLTTFMEQLEKAFDAYILIKGAEEIDGKKFLHGPAALVEEDGLGSDFDKDDLAKAAVVSGLVTFERIGGQVDWDHLYAKTHDPKHIIGKLAGITDNPGGGAPIVTTELFMGKALAKSAWEHHEAGGILGYSLQGIAKARDPKNSKRITDLDIHMMTITPMPKGFEGPRLSAGNVSLGAIMKGLSAELEAGNTEGWERIEEIEPVEKALMAGSGIVQQGETTGAALRTQDLAGASKARTPNPNGVKCSCADKKRKRKIAAMPQMLNKALVAELTRMGAVNAVGIASAVAKAVGADDQALASKIRESYHTHSKRSNGSVAPHGEWVHTPVTHNGVTQHFLATTESHNRTRIAPVYLRKLRKTSGGSPYFQQHKLDGKGSMTQMTSRGSQNYEYPDRMDITRHPHHVFQPELENAESTLRAGIDKHKSRT